VAVLHSDELAKSLSCWRRRIERAADPRGSRAGAEKAVSGHVWQTTRRRDGTWQRGFMPLAEVVKGGPPEATDAREPSGAWTSDPGPLRCPRCHGALRPTDAGFGCDAEGCGASFPIRDGVLVVRDAPTDDNKIAADFYNSRLWPKVRFWESLFWVFNGGERRARDVVLRRLRKSPGLRLLDVAIGDGVYTSWLPEDWSIVGIDISATQLSALFWARPRTCPFATGSSTLC
jgi:hypothetical protein